MQTFAAPPRNVPHSRERDVDEEFSRAGHHQRGAEHEEADHRVGESLHRDAEQALAGQHVIGDRQIERRLRAPERPEPFRVGKQRIDGEGQHAEQQAPAAGAPQRLHQHDPHDPAGDDHALRRAAEFPAVRRGRADELHQVDRGAEGDRRTARYRTRECDRAARCWCRKDQERERQHQRDQQVEVFGIELRVADEEAQRELLVDAEEDRQRGRDDQRPAPDALQRADAGDFGFVQAGEPQHADRRTRCVSAYRKILLSWKSV